MSKFIQEYLSRVIHSLDLLVNLAAENLALRHHLVLLKLGLDASERTVSGLLRRILRSYFEYYNNDRTHLGLEKETPRKRPVSNRASPSAKLIELPRVGGLHHRYEWSEAV